MAAIRPRACDAVAKGTFRSLKVFNYRVWTIGSLVSNVETWMQRAAQDWLVLTELTYHSASAVGIVTQAVSASGSMAALVALVYIIGRRQTRARWNKGDR